MKQKKRKKNEFVKIPVSVLRFLLFMAVCVYAEVILEEYGIAHRKQVIEQAYLQNAKADRVLEHESLCLDGKDQSKEKYLAHISPEYRHLFKFLGHKEFKGMSCWEFEDKEINAVKDKNGKNIPVFLIPENWNKVQISGFYFDHFDGSGELYTPIHF